MTKLIFLIGGFVGIAVTAAVSRLFPSSDKDDTAVTVCCYLVFSAYVLIGVLAPFDLIK